MERHMLHSKKEAFGVFGQSSFGKVVRTQATLLWIEEKVQARKERREVWAPQRQLAVSGRSRDSGWSCAVLRGQTLEYPKCWWERQTEKERLSHRGAGVLAA